MAIKFRITSIALQIRHRPNEDRQRAVHAELQNGKCFTYTVGRTAAEARERAYTLDSVHVHALSRADALAHKPITVGIPAGYRFVGRAAP